MQKKSKVWLTVIITLVVVLALFMARAYFFDKFGITADVAQTEKEVGSKVVKDGDFANDTLVRTKVDGNFIRLKQGDTDQVCGNAPENDPSLVPNTGSMKINVTEAYPSSKQEPLYGYYVGKDATFYQNNISLSLTEADEDLASSAPGLKVRRGTGWVYFELDKATISKDPTATKRVKGTISFSDLDLKASSIKNVSAEKINDGQEDVAGNNDEVSVDVAGKTINFFLATNSTDIDGFYINYCYSGTYSAKGYVDGVIDLGKQNSLSKFVVEQVDVNRDTTKMHLTAALSKDGQNWTDDYLVRNASSLTFKDVPYADQFCYRYLRYRIRLISKTQDLRPGFASLHVFGGGKCTVQPEESKAECNDGVDNDGDGKIDYPDDPGCSAPMDNSETDPEVICQDGTGENMRLKIQFDQVENEGNGNMKKRVYVDQNSNFYKSGQWIDLVEDGVAIVDNSLDEDVPGIAVQRGDGYVYVSLSGKHQRDEGKEITTGKIVFDNTTVSEIKNGTKETGDDVRNGPFDGQGDGKYELGKSGQDEYWTGETTGGNSNLVEFFSTTTTNEDSFFIYYDYVSKVGGGCQCQDGVDNDGDGLIDFPDDPGCTSPTDDDERDDSPIVSTTECSDGVDNDGDGYIDYPDDPGCTSLMDDQELDPKVVCQDGSGRNVKAKVVFDVVSNAGDGDMKKQIYVGTEEDFYKEGDWIDLVSDGVAIKDSQVNRDKPGVVLQRGEGYFFVSLYGHSEDEAGREIVSAKIELDNGYVVKTINGRKKKDGESEWDGPFENQGDGIYQLGVATQDEYIEGEFAPENPGPSLVEIYSTTSVGSDSLYVYYDYDPLQGGGCQCQDGVDNDGDGFIDYPDDPGCDSSTDDDEKDNFGEIMGDPGRILPAVIKSGIAFWVLVAITLIIGGFVIYRIARSEDEIQSS